jgi:hypothetical protein
MNFSPSREKVVVTERLRGGPPGNVVSIKALADPRH